MVGAAVGASVGSAVGVGVGAPEAGAFAGGPAPGAARQPPSSDAAPPATSHSTPRRFIPTLTSLAPARRGHAPEASFFRALVWPGYSLALQCVSLFGVGALLSWLRWLSSRAAPRQPPSRWQTPCRHPPTPRPPPRRPVRPPRVQRPLLPRRPSS